MKSRVCRIAAVCLAAALSLALPLPAMAAETATIALDQKAAAPGEVVTYQIRMNAGASFSGLSFDIGFDDTRLSYINGSASCGIQELGAPSLFYNSTKGVVSFAWESESSVTVKGTGTLLTMKFKVLDTAAAGDAAVRYIAGEFYRYLGGKDFAEFAVTAPDGKIAVSVPATDPAAAALIRQIDAIGTVTYPGSEAAILAALDAYADMTLTQRRQVSNYAVLTAASERFSELKGEALRTQLEKEVAAYTAAHAQALSLNVVSVRLADRDRVEAAIAAYDSLSVLARAELNNKRGLLATLQVQLEKLQKAKDQEEAARQEEERLRREAQQIAADYRSAFQNILKLDVGKVTTDDKSGVSAALLEMDSVELVNLYAYEMLQPERDLLNALFARIQQIEIERDPDMEASIIAANQYRRNFGWILSQTERSVTAEDIVDIRVALEVAQLQEGGAKKLLADEIALLNRLLTRAQELAAKEPENTTGTTQAGPAATGTQPEEPQPTGTNPQQPDAVDPGADDGPPAAGADQKIVIQTVTPKMGNTVWILMGLLGVSTTVMVVLRLLYARQRNAGLQKGATL